jgi:hypothetical protein
MVCDEDRISPCHLGTQKLASTDGLDVRKGGVLVVIQVVEDLVVRCAKGADGGGFEAGQNDGPKYVVDGECAHVLKHAVDITDLTKVDVNSVLGVSIPGHEASDLTGKKDSLQDCSIRCLQEDRVRVRTSTSMILIWCR